MHTVEKSWTLLLARSQAFLRLAAMLEDPMHGLGSSYHETSESGEYHFGNYIAVSSL